MPKKPAKTPTDYLNKKQEQLGKAIRYIGILGARFTCPTCGKGGSRMLIWEHAGEAYCSRNCIPAPNKETS